MTSSTSNNTMKCPTCNCEHHAKTDVFGNSKKGIDGGDFDVREIFGISGTCPICMEECSEVVALPCGHILCRDDYERMGGLVKSLNTQGSNIDDNEDSLLIHIRKAGQHGVNGTYRRHCHLKNKYTSMGRYDGRDVEYYIELRVNDNTKWWFLSCDLGQNPQGGSDIIDFYKAKVNLRFAYPSHITWQAASFQYGTFPAPKVSDSRCEDRVHF